MSNIAKQKGYLVCGYPLFFYESIDLRYSYIFIYYNKIYKK